MAWPTWNGAGTFTRTAAQWQNDAASGILIQADRHDNNDQGLATGINACLAKNGENAFTGTTGSTAFRGAVDNTSDLGSTSLRWRNLYAGTSVVFQGASFATTVTAAPTANRAIALPDLAGTVALRSEIPPTITTITSGVAQTFNPASTTVAMLVECWGGGGGSGGVACALGESAISGPGGAGGYCALFISSPAAAYTYTVGIAGTAGSAGNNNGGAGADTTFTDGASVNMVAGGGAFGAGMASTAGNNAATGAAGGTASGGDINYTGADADGKSVVSGILAGLPRSGGAPIVGGGVRCAVNNPGVAGRNPGEGGGAASQTNSLTNRAGAAGFRGQIRITQFK